jgi:cytochrome c553
MPSPRACLAFVAAVLAFASPYSHAADAANGGRLYNSICASCHGNPPAGGPERAAGAPDVIRNAINSKPQMQFLRGVFSNADIADIAEYILSLNSPIGPTDPAPDFNYTDLWWNPSESGWGFNIIQHPSNIIFAVIYAYIAPNRPMWFVLPGGRWTSSTTYTGDVYRVTGSPGNAAFRAGQATKVGDFTIHFTDSSHANFVYTVDGVQVTKTIERQPF